MTSIFAIIETSDHTALGAERVPAVVIQIAAVSTDSRVFCFPGNDPSAFFAVSSQGFRIAFCHSSGLAWPLESSSFRADFRECQARLQPASGPMHCGGCMECPTKSWHPGSRAPRAGDDAPAANRIHTTGTRIRYRRNPQPRFKRGNCRKCTQEVNKQIPWFCHEIRPHAGAIIVEGQTGAIKRQSACPKRCTSACAALIGNHAMQYAHNCEHSRTPWEKPCRVESILTWDDDSNFQRGNNGLAVRAHHPLRKKRAPSVLKATDALIRTHSTPPKPARRVLLLRSRGEEKHSKITFKWARFGGLFVVENKGENGICGVLQQKCKRS